MRRSTKAKSDSDRCVFLLPTHIVLALIREGYEQLRLTVPRSTTYEQLKVLSGLWGRRARRQAWASREFGDCPRFRGWRRACHCFEHPHARPPFAVIPPNQAIVEYELDAPGVFAKYNIGAPGAANPVLAPGISIGDMFSPNTVLVSGTWE